MSLERTKMRIDKNRACGIFIDYQEKLVPAQYEKEAFVENSIKLAKGLIALEVPLIALEQYPKGLGGTVDELKSIPDFPLGMPKISFSCVLNEDIKNTIKLTGARQVIVCGCETHICVLQTVTDLIEMGMSVYLVEDCCTSRTLKNHNIGISRAKQEGAFITSCESVLFELLQISGGETFKTISNLIK